MSRSCEAPGIRHRMRTSTPQRHGGLPSWTLAHTVACGPSAAPWISEAPSGREAAGEAGWQSAGPTLSGSGTVPVLARPADRPPRVRGAAGGEQGPGHEEQREPGAARASVPPCRMSDHGHFSAGLGSRGVTR